MKSDFDSFLMRSRPPLFSHGKRFLSKKPSTNSILFLEMCSIFLSKILVATSWWRTTGASMKQLHFLGNITPFIVRCFSSSKHHFFNSFLHPCGLSPEAACYFDLQQMPFKNPKNPYSVLALLRNHGCTYIHISKIVAKYPLPL